MAQEIISSMLTYEGVDGKLDAYLARPDVKERRPAVIVIHEIYGLLDHTKDVANRFARQGYVALAPSLFSRPGLGETLTRANIDTMLQFLSTLPAERRYDNAFIEQELARLPAGQQETIRNVRSLLYGGLPKDKMTQDLVKARQYLAAQSFVQAERIGSVGFCFGGGMSINLACHTPLAATVIFYGENPTPIDLIKNVAGPVLGIYGAEDLRINSRLDDLVKAMVQNKKDFEMRIYPGAAHAFFNDTNANTYRAEQAQAAWEQVLAFYQRTLQTA